MGGGGGGGSTFIHGGELCMEGDYTWREDRNDGSYIWEGENLHTWGITYDDMGAPCLRVRSTFPGTTCPYPSDNPEAY